MPLIFTILIFIAFLLYLWYTFSIIYHYIRFGIGREPKILAWIFFIGSFLLFMITLVLFSQINWGEISQFISNKIKIH